MKQNWNLCILASPCFNSGQSRLWMIYLNTISVYFRKFIFPKALRHSVHFFPKYQFPVRPNWSGDPRPSNLIFWIGKWKVWIGAGWLSDILVQEEHLCGAMLGDISSRWVEAPLGLIMVRLPGTPAQATHHIRPLDLYIEIQKQIEGKNFHLWNKSV